MTVWPLWGLELHCADLVLRPMTDADIVRIGPIAHGLLEPGERRFMPGLASSLAPTVEETTRNILRWYWREQGALSPTKWDIVFAVFRGDEPVGVQGIHAVDFPVLREVKTGSYLDRNVHGQGIGTRMRAMAIEFSVAHLGATTIRSAYADGNDASRVVSERLGYEADGDDLVVFEGERLVVRRMRLASERWPDARPEWLVDLEVRGADAVIDLLGLAPQDN